MEKTCRKCNKKKPLATDGSWCKDCHREYSRQRHIRLYGLPKPRPRTTAVCLNCGQTFRSTPSALVRAKHCSRACRLAYAARPIVRTCAYCGKEFHADSSKRKYCSRQCGGHGTSRTPAPPRLCAREGCQNTVRRQRRYCSRSCVPHPPSRKCKTCGSLLPPKRERASIYCGVACKPARTWRRLGTTCRRGHPIEGNLYVSPKGNRTCRICTREANRALRCTPEGKARNAEHSRRHNLKRRYGYYGPFMTAEQRRAVLADRCAFAAYGNCYGGLELDHIVPISKGGLDAFDNVQTLCQWHNGLKGDAVGDELIDRLLIAGQKGL